MNKKLLAVAVAGALALPGVALAQSSVTISGVFKMSIDNQKLRNSAKTPSSEMRLADDSSQVHFNIVEDLGGGLSAIAKLDWRVTPDQGGDNTGGNSFVGLRSKSWGEIILGRHDLHYFNRESNLTLHGSLKADSGSLLYFAGGGGTAIAGGTRTPNVIRYITPNYGGFTLIAAMSTSGAAASGATITEADIGSGIRKGRSWHLNPNLQGSNYQIGYSYWSSKVDAALGPDQRGDRLYGSYGWGGLRVGLAWDKSKTKAVNAVTGVTTAASDRTAWSIPVSYTWGPHQIHGHYTKARDDKVIAGNNGAKMFALGYAYVLSKRTSVGLTYANINNDAAAAYNFFTTVALGSASAAAGAGEDPRMFAATLRHAF